MTLRRPHSKGFTLIELLVVIAIIAILAAILFPVFAQAREKARQTTCASNEDQLGLAIMQYEQDNNEIVFFQRPVPSGSPATAAQQGWAGPVYPYVKSAGVYDCPDDPTQTNNTYNPPHVPVSYFINRNVVGETLAQFVAPASTVLLAEEQGATVAVTNPNEDYSPAGNCIGGVTDSGGESGISGGAASYATGLFPGRTFATISGKTAHSLGSNFLAADGHVQFLAPGRLSSGANASASANQQDAGTAGSGIATGTACMDNNPADVTKGCDTPNSASLTFSLT